jgi:hypothetical protein
MLLYTIMNLTLRETFVLSFLCGFLLCYFLKDTYEGWKNKSYYMKPVSRDYNNMIEKWNCDEQPTCIDPLYKEERHTLI